MIDDKEISSGSDREYSNGENSDKESSGGENSGVKHQMNKIMMKKI